MGPREIRESSWSTATRFSLGAVTGRMMSKEPTIIELQMDELKELLRRAAARQFNDQDYETTRTVFQSYLELLDLLKSKNISIRRLRCSSARARRRRRR
jgi:hypothetical protein